MNMNKGGMECACVCESVCGGGGAEYFMVIVKGHMLWYWHLGLLVLSSRDCANPAHNLVINSPRWVEEALQ